MTEQPNDRKWHLDKKVPLALVIMLGLQTVGAVWWASSLSGRVERLENDMKASAPQAERLTRVEVRLENVQDGVKRIEQLLSTRPPN